MTLKGTSKNRPSASLPAIGHSLRRTSSTPHSGLGGRLASGQFLEVPGENGVFRGALKGKRALVTGGSRRIGAAIARALAGEGCHLILHHYHEREEADRLVAELKKKGVQVTLFKANLENEGETLRLAKAALRGGPIDILINNASIFYPTPFEKITPRDWGRFLSLHLKAPFLLSRYLGLRMAARRCSGRIVNIVDRAAKRPYRRYLPYCVSKGALLTLTQALAIELAPYVQVNSISPGPMVPPPGMERNLMKKIQEKTLLKRWGGEGEIVKAVLFLCTSDFTTGSDLLIDGGQWLV